MTDLIEKVARAICEADGYAPDPAPEFDDEWIRNDMRKRGWPYPCRAGWLRYEEQAKAALAVIEQEQN